MLQFLPALILLLLQSQGYASRVGSEQVATKLLGVGYCQHLSQSTNKAVRVAQRALLVQLLATNSDNPNLSEQLRGLLQAINLPAEACTDSSQRAGGENSAWICFPPPRVSRILAPLSSAQRLRDGPGSLV